MDIEFQKRLLAIFRDETKEHLAAISDGLLALEKAVEPEMRQKVLESVFREAHSLKGAARSVGMSGIESLSHALEGVFAGIKRREVTTTPVLFDLLHRAADGIAGMILADETGRDAAGEPSLTDLIARLNQAAKNAPPPPPETAAPREVQEPAPAGKSAVSDTVRISAAKLDSLLRQAEEMLTAKQAALQRAQELKEISADLAAWQKEWKKLRPALGKMRKLQQTTVAGNSEDKPAADMDRLLAFCEWGHAAVKSLEHKVSALDKARANDRHIMEGMVDSLVNDLKGVLMLPCSTVLGHLPRMARDLARERGKDAELVIVGESVEIDKRVLEELKYPLIHLVRNCIDHGMEKADERKRRNKPATGTIRIGIALKDSNLVELIVSDDGRGIDTAAVAAAAVRQGIMTQDQAKLMERDELLGVAFMSGLSTAPLITDISGRGLGLTIVREKVEKLGGTVMVTSETNKGTTFRMVVPLSLSTCRGVLVAVGEQTFIIPASGVEQVARIDRNALKTVENRDTVELGGEALSFVLLSDVLQLPRKERSNEDAGMVPLFVSGSGARRIAFGVDDVLDEHEVLVKSLGPQLARIRNIAGATVLGTGKVVAILHPGDLMKSAVKESFAPAAAAFKAEPIEAERRSVLIAEDSITARTLLKNILDAAGYLTVTAVDGIDALTQLRTHGIDLVVSDVDMPRMNGFELTAKIRSLREFDDLPVVLVTSLDSREDRERGIEVGASAYIVKSSFDQSNLLDVVKRLL
jgi:two-component system, chemotaxis family, sensor kinase CheA